MPMANTSEPREKLRAVTRPSILHEQWQADEDHNLELVSTCGSTASSDVSSVVCSEDGGAAAEAFENLPANASIGETITWLDAQCKLEQAKMDWGLEYKPCAREDSLPNEGLEIAVLRRIRRGHGPRASKFEDLLAPLRSMDDGAAPRFSKQPRAETYEEMQKVLCKWNEHVASVRPQSPQAREVLMKSMRDRIVFLDRTMVNRWSADAHEDTCRKLLLAIHVYRPETVDFNTKDPMDLILIIIAHLGYAIPDIDHDLQYRMLYTLATERRNSALVANVETKHKFEQNISEAIKQGDVEGAARYEEKLSSWIRAGLQKNCDIIVKKIRTARRNIGQKVLGELQELTVLQTAQKLVLRERISALRPPSQDLIPRSVWWPERADTCGIAESNLEENVEEHIEDLLSSWRVASRHIDEMKDINRARILTRAIKFNGYDLEHSTEDERNRIVQERMAHPGTVVMMMDAAKAITEMNDKAIAMIESATDMDQKLESILSAIVAVHSEFDNLSKLVDSDPHMVVEGAGEGVFSIADIAMSRRIK